MNSRIRNNELLAKEMITQRDQKTGNLLTVSDHTLSPQQEIIRENNHLPSSLSKSNGGNTAQKANVKKVGDLVFIKDDGSKM